MRYIVAIAAAFLVLLFLGATTGFGEWPRPWGPISRGAVGGTIAIGVLIVWEQLYPREDSLTDEEKARLRDEERASLRDEENPAAEAGSPSLPDEDDPSVPDDGPRG